MLFKLSIKNIKKSIKDYSIYFFTLVIAVMIFYIFNSIDAQTSFLTLSENKADIAQALVKILGYISVFVSIILGFLIIYSNNFIIKRRKKELGLYLTLGMSKRKVSIILVIETILVGIVSLFTGLILGILVSQGLSIFAASLFEVNLESFHFVFSSSALVKTILYFGLIFILVMIFNTIILSKHKLIDLLNASKRSENVKAKNKYLVLFIFVISMTFLGIAYNYLFNDALITFNKDTLWMFIFGALSVLLFFYSLSGFALWIFKRSKKIYYKKLNMFILRQVNSKMNTMVFSNTIIALMLLLTIGILSGSLSLSSAFNDALASNNLTDFTAYGTYYDENSSIIENLKKASDDDNFSNYVSDYVIYTQYNQDIYMDEVLSQKGITNLSGILGYSMDQLEMDIIKKSDYIKIMNLYGMENDIIDLKDDEYLIVGNMDTINEYYEERLVDSNIIVLNNNELKPVVNYVQKMPLFNSNTDSNAGVIIVNDDLITTDANLSQYIMIGNFVNHSLADDEFNADFNIYVNSMFSYDSINSNLDHNIYFYFKSDMYLAGVSIKILMTYIGLYLGIIFAISSVTVLAIKELSESSDNKERYHILRLIGTDEKIINKTLLSQIFISFMIPLSVALFHAFFGLKELNNIIKIFININLTKNIFITSLFIVIIYGGYFLATYFSSKRVIKE